MVGHIAQSGNVATRKLPEVDDSSTQNANGPVETAISPSHVSSLLPESQNTMDTITTPDVPAIRFVDLEDPFGQANLAVKLADYTAFAMLGDVTGTNRHQIDEDEADILIYATTQARIAVSELRERFYLACEADRHTPPPPRPVPKDDPLLNLICEYEWEKKRYDASTDLPLQKDLEKAETTWLPHYRRLCDAPPAATTLAGAVLGIRLVADEEEHIGHDENLTVNVLRAALAYFDGATA